MVLPCFHRIIDDNSLAIVVIIQIFTIQSNLGKLKVHSIQKNGIDILNHIKLIPNATIDPVFNRFGFNKNIGMYKIHFILDLSGQELYTTLRRRLEDLPVFFVSDQYSLDDERAVMSLGGVNYVCKPLEMLSFRELAETAKSLALMG